MASGFEQTMWNEGEVLPRLRVELENSAQVFAGQPYWVYKDPISLRYYRFNREEHFLIEQLREPMTLDQLKDAHDREFHSGELSTSELAQFVQSLMEKNLLLLNQPDRDAILYQKHRKRRWKKVFGQLTSFLFIKIPVCDPDRFFGRLAKRMRFFWSYRFLMMYLLLLGVAGLLIIRRWPDFREMFWGNFFTIYNLPILFGALWVTKGLHEFGHGLTCKHYGGEVHEVGILFLVFMPMLYCNITDAWTFPDKRHRLLVTAGGILTEVILAGLAAVVWYYTEEPGFIHAFAFNMVIVCSLSTVLFNANPLLKFDGYYFMMDLAEVPNLRQRSSEYMKNVLVKYVFGGYVEDMSEEHRFRYVFPIYSASAMLYRYFIVFSISFSLYRMLKSVRLQVLGQFLVVSAVVTMLLIPLMKSGKQLFKNRRQLGISNVRLLILLGIVVVFAGVVLSWPMRQHVTLNFVLEPVKMEWLRSEVAGQVHWQEGVEEGLWVDSEGVVLASLENPELEYEAVKIATEIEQLKIELDIRQAGEERMTEGFRERLLSLQKEKGRLEEQIAGLKVRSPFSGEILTRQEELTLLQAREVPRSSALLLLADTREMAAKVWVPEKTYARIFQEGSRLGQEATLKLYAFADKNFKGRVTGVSAHREDHMGEFNEKLALSNKVGGEVLTEYDAVTDRERPMEAVYEVTITLDEESLKEAGDESFRAYMSGRVRLDCGRFTLYQWGRDSLLRFISPEVRL